MITLVIVVAVIAVVAVLSAQNAVPVSVSVLFWRFDASLSVVILITVLAGMILGMAVLSWARMRRTSREKQRTKDAGRTGPEGSS